jgi:KipI family sensor histidine kinase inhibitor
VSRREPGAVLHDADEVAERMLRLAADGVLTAIDGSTVRIEAESVCVHGDSPGAVEMARQVRRGSNRLGVAIRPFVDSLADDHRMTMRFLPVNLNALLVELDDLPQTLALLASLRAEPIAGIEELVPAARTLLVTFRPAAVGADELVRRIGQRSLGARETRIDKRIEIPVRYDGEDLAEVAALLGIAPEEVVRRHTGSDYTVAFTGFAPGFAYLSGGDASLNVPRRKVPRTRIPAGAVGLAGSFSGVYPQASPGGWQIIGITDAPMWDLSRETPALLQPGDTVRFVDVSGSRRRCLPLPSPRLRNLPPPTTAAPSRSAPPACRRCCRTAAAMGRRSRACPPRARWTGARCKRPTGSSAMRRTWPASRSPTAASSSPAAAMRWWPSPVPTRP